MASASAKFKSAKEAIAKAQKELEATAKNAMKELAGEFFESNPRIEAIGWTQYTPYWNDGDTCYFEANTDYPFVLFTAKNGKTIKLSEWDTYEVDVEGDDQEPENPEEYEKEGKGFVNAAKKFLKDFDNDDLETMFGDHVEVIVRNSGKIDVEEHEHE